MSEIKERLDRLRALVQDQDFLDGKGLSNEVNIRIFCYDASDEMIVRHFTSQLIADQSLGCHIIECNLYEIFLNICNDMGIAQEIPFMENDSGKYFLLDQLHSIATESAFIEEIQYAPHENGDVLMFTGIGEVFPFMRIHSLLEALQPHFSDIPILVMYPGTFDGNYLRLFDKLTPNPYYRAFNVV